MRKKILALALALIPMLGFSQHRSESDALAVAQEFWGNKVNRARLNVVSQNRIAEAKARAIAKPATAASQNKQSFYVINDEERNRFVIVSSDERLYKILGYSDNGVFNPETAPEGLLDMLNGYDAQYMLIKDKLPSANNVSTIAPIEPIEPMIQTRWGQMAPYNNDCPQNKRASDGSKCASGCVATAMAQVMNYYKYPNVGKGIYLYQSATQGYILMQDFSNTTFDWNRLTNTYNESSAEESKAEVAKLMKACGVSVSMDYGQSSDGSSGAAPTDIPYALINYFGYNENVNYKSKDYYTPEEWESMIMEELNAGRPILYGGFDSNYRNGHRFILDGCDTNGLYHFNFGWTMTSMSYLDGYGNGYYSLDILKVTDPVINFLMQEEIDLGDFSYYQSMICNVSPETVGTHEDIFYSSSSFSLPKSIKTGANGQFSFSATNYTSSSSSTDINKPMFKGVLGVGLYDTDFNYIKSLYQETNESKLNHWEYVSGKLAVENTTFTDGSVYYIAPYAKGDGYDIPTRIRGKQGVTEYYLAETKNGEVKLTANGVASPHVIVTGSYVISANGGEKEWQVELAKDNNIENRYVITNLDPAVNDIKEVYATSNSSGTQLTIALNQDIQDNTHLYNITDPDKIVLSVNTADNSMYINDTWGSIQIVGEGESATQKEISRYSNTKISYGTLEPTPSVVVSSPVISVSEESNMISILCGTENAKIFYTIDGSAPTAEATLYTNAFEVKHNCVVKCVAVVEDKSSEVVTKTVNWFTMSKPKISMSTDKKSVIMESEDKDAIIYYTTDGSTPTNTSYQYTAPVSNPETTTYKAIAVKENFNNSPVETFIAEGSTIDKLIAIVTDNKAGELAEKLNDATKYNILSMTITGQLNGTDIKYLREILHKGKLAKLDLAGASIVSGGEKYDGIYSTKDNVIGDNMFSHSESLISVILPSNVTTINSFAFTYCTNLPSITLPEKCNSISEYALSGCKELKEILVEEGNQYFKSKDGILFSYGGDILYKVPFAKDVRGYSIPSDVKKLGGRAFEETNIATLALPANLEEIGKYAFASCNNISDVIIPDNVSKLGEGAFQSCKNLSSIILSSSIKKIESFTFSYCVNLRSLSLSKAVESINQHALNNCSSLQSITVDEENENFCSYNGVLYSKDMKTIVIYPRGLQSEEYYIADGVEVIYPRAFADCHKIQKVFVPSSVKEVGSYAFNGSSVSVLNLPNTIEKIGEYAFSSCDSLSLLSIPDSITRIENGMLSYCDNITYLKIPQSIEYIGLSAFIGCKSLDEIECWIKNIDDVEFYTSSYFNEVQAFENIKIDCTWHVPNGCSDAYKSQPWWVSTWNIIDDLIDSADDIESITNDTDMKVIPGEHSVGIVSSTDKTVNIYNLQGYLVNSVKANAGQITTVPLQSGVYVINRNKIRIK